MVIARCDLRPSSKDFTVTGAGRRQPVLDRDRDLQTRQREPDRSRYSSPFIRVAHAETRLRRAVALEGWLANPVRDLRRQIGWKWRGSRDRQPEWPKPVEAHRVEAAKALVHRGNREYHAP